jgi:hypothetical protein
MCKEVRHEGPEVHMDIANYLSEIRKLAASGPSSTRGQRLFLEANPQ